MLRYCFLSLILLTGCASAPLTDDEQFAREYKLAMAIENWAACERIYANAGKPTIHMDHMHTRHLPDQRWMLARDLSMNHCRFLLGVEGWAGSISE